MHRAQLVPKVSRRICFTVGTSDILHASIIVVHSPELGSPQLHLLQDSTIFLKGVTSSNGQEMTQKLS